MDEQAGRVKVRNASLDGGDPADDREGLRQLLTTCVLHALPEAPLTSRDGSRVPWMFYSWIASMTSDGMRLIGNQMCSVLSSFTSSQLASTGYTGLPILAACL